VDAYLVAAFWIANDGGRPDLALRILEEGRWNNPYSYEMALEIARLDLRMGKLDQARQALDAGLRFWNKTADPKSEGSRSDLASLLLYRSILHEIDGEGAEAVVNLESIIALFPDRAHLRAQIAAIKRGENMPQEAAKRLMDTLRAEARQRSACRHEAAEADESHQHVDTH
jgi:chorismate mutase